MYIRHHRFLCDKLMLISNLHCLLSRFDIVIILEALIIQQDLQEIYVGVIVANKVK